MDKATKAIIAVIEGILLLPVIGVGIFYAGCSIRLYSEIGAVPWSIPDTKVTLAQSDAYSAEDIQSAADCALADYRNKWYHYNGFYLLELEYVDGDYETDNGHELLYFKAVTFSGIDTGWSPDMAYDSLGLWTVEKKDGEWISRGWGHC